MALPTTYRHLRIQTAWVIIFYFPLYQKRTVSHLALDLGLYYELNPRSFASIESSVKGLYYKSNPRSFEKEWRRVK